MNEEEEYDAFWRFVLNNKAALFFLLWDLFWVWLLGYSVYKTYSNFEYWKGSGECYESLDAYAGCVCQSGLFLVVPLVAGVIMWRRKIRFYKLVLALPMVYLAGNVLYWRFWGNL